jgi:hypothetical protein
MMPGRGRRTLDDRAAFSGRGRLGLLITDLAAGRGVLTDAAWERIAPVLLEVDGRKRPCPEHWKVINRVPWR